MDRVDISAIKDSTTLRARLQAIDISVPLRTEGRTSDHTERWVICRLLATLDKHGRLSFPLSVTHRDRPDFLVNGNQGQVGVEATEAISQQYAAFSLLAEREFPDVLLEPGQFKWDSPERTPDEMREILRQGRLTAAPWVGDRPEQEWAQYMESIIRAKLKKLQRVNFGKYAENWLAIYDNLPLPNVHLQKASLRLRPLISDVWNETPTFQRVFIERGLMILELRSDGTNQLVLEDLW